MSTPQESAKEREWQDALDREAAARRRLLREANRAQDLFSPDDLEDHAQKLRQAGLL